MNRNISELENQTFDVIIVGGGIHGAAAAWQCSAQGLKTALIEKNDFGSATSANSLKIIHGGFRYLQHLNIKRMRESIISRNIMLQISPHNVKPLRCVIPNSGWGLRSRFLMRIALFLNDIIAYDRNKGLDDISRIPSGTMLSIRECKEQFKTIDWTGKTGGTVWYDAIAENSERLSLAFVKHAARQGSSIANYLEMRELLVDDGKVAGCQAYDSIGQRKITIKGSALVIAGGASNDIILGKHQAKNYLQKEWAKAVNIVVKKRLLTDSAIGLTGEGDFIDKDAVIKKKGRFFFFVPWREHTMIGTTYTFNSSDPGHVKANKKDIEEILEEVNSILPKAELSLEDIGTVHAGLVPAYRSKTSKEDVQLVKETEVYNLGEKIVNSVDGLFAVKSVKYTTAPLVAAEIAEKTAQYLGKKIKTKITFDSVRDTWTGLSETNEDFSNHAVILTRYGNDAEGVMKFLLKDNAVICEDSQLYYAEVDFFIEEEMAQTLGDIVFRRSALGSAECPSHNVLEKIAARMADHFHWNADRIASEIQQVKDAFVWN